MKTYTVLCYKVSHTHSCYIYLLTFIDHADVDIDVNGRKMCHLSSSKLIAGWSTYAVASAGMLSIFC